MVRQRQFWPFRIRRSIRTQVLLLLLTVLVALTLLVTLLTETILLRSFENLERQQAVQAVQRVQAVLAYELDSLDQFALDWSVWDETYAFLQGQAPEFVNANLNDALFETQRLSLVLLIDNAGGLAFGRVIRVEDHTPMTLDTALILEYVRSFSSLGQYYTNATTPGSYTSGLVATPFGPMLIAVHPVLRSSGAGPAQGYLVVGRYVDQELIALLGETARSGVVVRAVTESDLPTDLLAVRDRLEREQAPVTRVLDRETLGGYMLLKDISGDPALILRVLAPRDITRQGRQTAHFFVVALIVLGSGLLLVLMLMLERRVLTHVLALDRAVRAIGERGDVAQRVPSAGPEELHSLGQGINLMLERIQQAQRTLAESERSARAFQERLVALVRVSVELTRETTLDDLCRRAIALGREALGFDRLGLFLLDETAEIVQGTWGTDTEGNLRDESHLRRPITQDMAIYEVLQRREFAHVWQDTPLYEDWQPVGRGWNAMASLLDGERTVGWFASDNLIHREPLAPYQLELLSLYGAIVGNLITRLQAESARRESDAALVAERTLLRTLIDTMPDAVYVKDTRGVFVLTNRATARYMGAESPEALLGTTDFDCYPRELAQAFAADDQRVLQTGEPISRIEPSYIRPGDPVRWVSTIKVPLRSASGAVIGLVGVGRDITAERQTAEALRENQERLDLALQASELGLWDWNLQTGEEVLNERWAAIVGYSLEELKNPSGLWQSLVHPDDWPFVEQELQAHLAGETLSYQAEYRMRTRTGDWRWILDRGRVVQRDDSGQAVRMIGTHLDITGQREAAAEREHLLEQARRRAAQLATVATVSQQITRILDSERLLWELSEIIRQDFAFYHAQVYLFNERNQQIELAAGSGEIGRTMVKQGRSIPLTHPSSIVATAARERHVVVANDVSQAPQFLPNPMLPDTRAEMALPMIVGERLIGVLDVQHNEANCFDEQQIQTQTTLAAQIAIAIHNAQLFTESARRLAIIEHAEYGVSLISIRTPYLFPTYINSAGLQMVGYASLDEVPGRTLAAFYPPDGVARLRREVLPAVRRAGLWRGELELLRRDGTRLPVEQIVFLIRDEQGHARDIATICTDITARRQAEQALRRANRAYRTLSDCNQAMVRAESEQGLLQEVCEIIVNVGGYRMAWVGLCTDPADASLAIPVAHAGYEDGYLDEVLRIRKALPDWPGPSRRAILSKTTTIMRDIQSDPSVPMWQEAMLARGYRAGISLPLIREGNVLGTLNVYSAETNVFDVQEITLLEELAGDLAYGMGVLRTRLERQQAEERVRQRNRELLALHDVARTLTATLDVRAIYRQLYEQVALPLFGAQTMVVAAYDPAIQQLTCTFAITDGQETDVSALPPMPLGEGPNSRTVRTGQGHILTLPPPDELPEVRGNYVAFGGGNVPRSAMFVPIISEGQVSGVISVQHYEPDAFEEADIPLFSAAANQAAVALRNAELFAAERDQRALAEALQAVVAAVNSTLEFDGVLDRILENIRRVVPHDTASVMLVEGNQARVVRHVGFAERGLAEYVESLRFDVARWPEFSGPVDQLKAVCLRDTHSEPTWQQSEELKWIRSYIGVPIVVGQRFVGVLNVDSATPGFFTDEHVQRLRVFADQVAVAVCNAQLFAAEHEQRVYAETLRDIAATLNRSLELEDVLAAILATIRRVVPHDAANIMLIDGGVARVVGATGYAERGLGEWIRQFVLPIEGGPGMGQLLETKRPRIIHDTQVDQEWIHVPETAWARACVAAPILRDDQVIGFLNLYSATPNFFTQERAERLQAFAYQASNAIRNAQLFTAERDQRALAEALRDTIATLSSSLDLQLVMDQILTNVGRVVPHDAANIMLLEDGVLYIALQHGYAERGFEQQIRNWRHALSDLPDLQQVVTTRQPLLIPDTALFPGWEVGELHESGWIRSTLKVPIVLDDQVIGILNLDADRPNAFTAEQTHMLASFTDYAATAIRNARLFAAERDQRALAEALRDTAETLGHTLDLDEVLQDLLSNVGKVMPHDATSLMLIDETSSEAYVVGNRGYERFGLIEWSYNLRLKIAEIADLAEAYRTGLPAIIPDTHADPHWHVFPQTSWIRSHATVPISQEGQVIGFLMLESTEEGYFTAAHVPALRAFASQAAIAVRNARFFAAEHAQRTLAEALRDTAQAVNSTLELDEVLDRILVYVGRAIPYDLANVLLIEGDDVRVARQYPADSPLVRVNSDGSVHFSLVQTPNLRLMVENGQPLVIPDVNTYPEWVKHPGLEWIQSHAAAPIRHDDRTIGFLTVDSTAPGFFARLHGERLAAFANQVGMAIRNARLYEAIQRHAAELEERVAERTAELEHRRAQLQVILDSIGEGVIYDEKLTVKYTNRALQQITGYEAEEMPHYLEPLRSSQYTEAEYAAQLNEIFEAVGTRGIWHGEMRLRRKDGVEFDADVTVTEVRNKDNDVVGAVTVLRDISLEKALRKQKDRFIASASHELRTPLTNFKTRLYLLQRQPEKAGQHLAILNKVANNMTELVENLLDVSRFERGVIIMRRRVAVLQDLIGAVVEIQRAEAEAKGITLITDLHPEPLRAFVDAPRMAQVVTNLITNAINYTPTGGAITIELHCNEGQPVRQAVLRVHDTGIGIPAAQLPHIFDPFFRANEEAAEGTGLGLTIAREIVRLHEGEISVESALGRGSTFTVTLDLLDDQSPDQ